ncbi:hypothetical protein N8612_02985 [Verrucomicrobia bacterium]|nr:hypothetical protein [Verrucomicrobiota bacterium]
MTIMHIDREALKSKVVERLLALREHAPYFSCRTDTETELHVAGLWFSAVEQHLPKNLEAIEHRANPLDPPDIVIRSPEGTRVGVELTELVDEISLKAARPPKQKPGYEAKPSNLRMPYPWREYSKDELFGLLQKRIARKDKSEFNEPPYDERHLVIYSDEPDLLSVHSHETIRNLSFQRLENLDHCWLLLPPPLLANHLDPNSEHCIAIPLRSA